MSKEMYFNMVYIGYYYYPGQQNILMCVSDNLHAVKAYLYNIRGLDKSNTDIREVVLDWDSVLSLYEDYILCEYMDPYEYLTQKDIAALSKEIDETMDRWNDLLIELKAYTKFIGDISRFSGSESVLSLAIREMEYHQGKVKNIRRMCKKIIADSPITSKNINRYLSSSKIIEEDRELTEMFYRAIDNDD